MSPPRQNQNSSPMVKRFVRNGCSELLCRDDFRFENLRDIPKGFFTCLGRTVVGLQSFLCCIKTTKIRLFFAGNSLTDTSIAIVVTVWSPKNTRRSSKMLL